MKNHRNHPVSDALGHLDEETVHACMSEDLPSRAIVARRELYRKLAVVAACLTVALATSIAITLPLMRANDPSTPDAVDSTPSTTDAPSLWEDGDTPFVRLWVLSYDESASDTENENASSNGLTIDANNYFRNSNLILRFDCAEGERVAITSHNTVSPISEELANTLAALEQLEDPEGDRNADVDEAVRKRLEKKLYALQRKYQASQTRYGIIEVDDFTYMWNVPQNPEEYEIIDFTIYNAEDEIVGAGSICVGIRYAYCLYQLRTAVLGSERFEAPISAEEATAYLDSLHATAEEAYAAMDFTPNSTTEGYALARSAVTDIRNAELPDPTQSDSCHSASGNCDFHWYTFNKIDEPETMRRFILFSDGSYVEIAVEGAAAYDGMLYAIFEATDFVEDDFSDLVLPLTDGRTLTFVEVTYTDPLYGYERTKWSAVITDGLQETV